MNFINKMSCENTYTTPQNYKLDKNECKQRKIFKYFHNRHKKESLKIPKIQILKPQYIARRKQLIPAAEDPVFIFTIHRFINFVHEYLVQYGHFNILQLS